MDYEAALITKAVESDAIREVLEARVSPELFALRKKEWNYVLDFYRNHGCAPDMSVFRAKFPEFEPVPNTAPLSFLVEELRNRLVYASTQAVMKEVGALLKSKAPMDALKLMKQAVLKMDFEARPARDVNVTENPTARVRAYDEVVAKGGMLGYETLWPILDERTRGFQNEDLIGIVARGGVGKTFAEVILARYHWCTGVEPVLLFTKEQSVDQIIRRFDAIHSSLPYQRFRSGELTTAEKERWLANLKAMEGAGNFWISGDDEEGGVSGVEAKIDRYKPKIVYIDAMYLLEDERDGNSREERLTNVTRDLKRIARRHHLPLVVSHQFNKEASGDTGSEDMLAYADVQKWFDLLIGMYQTEDLRLNKEMLLRILKQREGEKLEFVTGWDLEKMVFDVKGGGRDDVGGSRGEVQFEEPVRF